MRKIHIYFYSIIISTFFWGCKKDKKIEPALAPTSWLTASLGTYRNYNADLNQVFVDTLIVDNKKCVQIYSLDNEEYSLIMIFEGRDTGKYELGTPFSNNSIGFLKPQPFSSIWKSILNSGSINITKYDTVNNKISGTFVGRLFRLEPPFDTLVINNGEFNDLNFTD